MVYALPISGRVDVGLMRTFGRPVKYCEIGLRTKHLDNKLRGHHDTENHIDGASTCRSP